MKPLVADWVKRRSQERNVVQGVADYGIDAPGVVRKLAVIGLLVLVGGVSIWAWYKGSYPVVARIALSNGIWAGGALMLSSVLMVRGSLVGKLRLRDELLATIPWRGTERVLDVGCGRGLLLIGAAKRLTTGSATGVDRWRVVDQSGNAAAHTRDNARAEDALARVALVTGDMRRLPFPDGAFDVVTSSWAIHNIADARGREAALREMVRVLAPGGRIAIADIGSVRRYRQVLAEAGLPHLTLSPLRFLFVIPSRMLYGARE